MRLTLTVVDPRDGAFADVVLDADSESPMSEVARVLESQLAGESTGSPSVYVDGLVVDPAIPVARSPLKEGTVVSLYTPAGCPPREVTGIVELRVAGGPDAGAVHRLGLGRTDIGRGAAAHVRIDDPELSDLALTVTVGPDGRCTVREHDEDDRITLDGVPLRERVGIGPVAVEWPLDSQLAVGGTLLELVAYLPPDAALRLSEDGTGFVFERPRRLLPGLERRSRVPMLFPRPVGRYAPPVFLRVLCRVLAAALLAAALSGWALTGKWYALSVALLSPLPLVAERYAGKQSRARSESAARQAQEILGAELRLLRSAAPSPAAVLSLATGPRARLWERRRGDHDHLLLRVGTGPTEGSLSAWALTDTPITLRLRDLGVIGLAGPGDAARALGRWAVAQIAALHSSLDVRVCVLTVKGAYHSWDWLRWLPHARPVGGVDVNTAIGTDAETVGARIGELVMLLLDRKRERESSGNADAPAPDIVVVCDGFRQLRSFPGVVQLLREGPDVGIFLLCLDEEERLLPAECRAIVVVEPPGPQLRDPWGAAAPVAGERPAHDRRSGLRLRVESAGAGVEAAADVPPQVRGVRPDFVSAPWCGRLARSLAPLRDASGEAESSALPARTRLLDVLGLEPPTGQLIAEGWTSGSPSTFAVIGETYDGPFGIDLRRDGPHALIAGTTGSGKSELLQTIIASLAVANSPEHLTFVLVDHKGGAAFQSCVQLPHTVAMVTNLDRYLVQRVLGSFTAELKRREHLLAAAGAKGIEDYHDLRRRTSGDLEPLPRLVIVIDEIATMVRELPDFISGVINVAQRGRSLGVHLLLATQRPSGVVSAEIRANTSLRIALRVTDSGESYDIVDSPEAARIPRSTPGRGYARLGHASLIPFQSGRVGGWHTDTAGSASRPPWAARLTWPDLGRAALAAPKAEPDRKAAVTDLAALVGAVRDAHAALGLPPQHSPWLPPLPEILLLDETGPVEAEGGGTRPGALSPVAFGVEDLPAEQRRRPVRIDFERFGHLLIGGAPRSGRSQVLRTIAGALARAHSCADVHLYGIDCGHNGLGPLAELPHCGALVTRRETERAARLMSRLTDELRRRQDTLAMQGFADISEQRAAVEPARRLPHLVVLLDGWEGWLPTFGEYEFGGLTDAVLDLMRQGAGVGIHLVITGDRQLLGGRIASLTEDKYGLRLADRSDYSLLGVRPGDVPEEMAAGRAVRAGHGTETQFALLSDDATDQAQAQALAVTGATAAARDAGVLRERRPFRVDALPNRIGFDEAWQLRDPEGSGSRLWTLVGVGGDEIAGYGPDLADGVPAFVIAGPPKSGRSTALLGVARSCIAQGVRLVVAAPRPSPLRELAGREGVLAVFTGTDILEDDFDRAVESASRERPIAVIVDDGEVLDDCDADPALKRLLQRGAEQGLALVLGGDEEDVCSGFSGWQVEAKKARRGLLLSPQESSSGDLIGFRIGRRAVGYPVQPGKGLLHLGDGRLLSVLIPSG